MPAGTVDVSVGGEWAFAQTLRHLVLATDIWLGRAVLGIDQPFHPVGLAGPGAEDDGLDMSVFTTATPSYADVLEVRASRVAMVRDFSRPSRRSAGLDVGPPMPRDHGPRPMSGLERVTRIELA